MSLLLLLSVYSIFSGTHAQADYTRHCPRVTDCTLRASPEDSFALLINESFSLNGNDAEIACVQCDKHHCFVEIPVERNKMQTRFKIYDTGKVDFFHIINVNFLGMPRGIACQYSVLPGLPEQTLGAESTSMPTFPTQYCPLREAYAERKTGTTDALALAFGMAAQTFYSAIQMQTTTTHCELKRRKIGCFQYTYDELKMKEAESILQLIGSSLRH